MCGAVFPSCFLVWGQIHASTRDSWMLTGKSESISCGDTAPLSWFLCAPGFVCALPKSVFPVLWKSVIKSHWPPKSNTQVVLSAFAGLWVGKFVVGPRTFLTVQEFPWSNCSAFCGSSAQQFCVGANGDLLQEGLCHMLHYAKSSSDNHFAF